MDSSLVPVAVEVECPLAGARDLTTDEEVAAFLSRLLPMTRNGENRSVAALLPWVCDRLLSPHSRRAYASDLARFVLHMRERNIDPLEVAGDDLRIYKAALLAADHKTATVARTLSVLRGTYQQFGKRGLVPWERVRDVQSVESPRVEKNTTPCLSQQEAIKLLHAPNRATMVGLRDYAMLFVYFKTAARCSAIRNARIGDIERTDFEWYLVVREKGGKTQRKALLEAAPAVLGYLDVAGIRDDLDGPLFRPVAKDRRTLLRKHLDRSAIWEAVKRNARKAGLAPDRVGRRGISVHTLRKTAITNALENGAPIQKVQQLAGHADIRTTQLYYRPSAKDSEEAARHIHIR